jgi:RNA 2',3'-cyclic 3'-phosphodiesterase
MRLFFAVTLPEDLLSKIAEVQRGLRGGIEDDGVRWTRPEQFHYTLKFLGEQPPQRAHKAIEVAASICEAQSPFELALGGVGAFPNTQRPSVLWLGAASGAAELVDLATRLDAALARQHFLRENKPPKAHLTLARIKTYSGETAARRALAGAEVGTIGAAVVDGFVLMQSALKPSGSEYNVVEQFRFARPREGGAGDSPAAG